MMKNFGRSYALPNVISWLTHDPSLFVSMGVMYLVYKLGNTNNLIQKLLTPVPLAFLLLTVYIWDLPFSNSLICRTLHDGRFDAWGFVLKTRHIYFFCIFLYSLMLLPSVIIKNRNASRL